jgi:5-methylcytosine-specific restriction protein A
MDFIEITKKIAYEYSKSRKEKFGSHPIADLIRRDWVNSLSQALNISTQDPVFKLQASAGQGQWSESPWLAIFNKEVTSSATNGYYPVFLFEPKFKSICLLLCQGAEKLIHNFGKKIAIAELRNRASIIRRNSKGWEKFGFITGPFQTIHHLESGDPSNAENDEWVAAIAFGKRYDIDAMPSLDALVKDIQFVLGLYLQLGKNKSLNFSKIDHDVEELKQNGELPKFQSIDGVKKTITHIEFEKRYRNQKLINQVKKELGTTCQACGFSFSDKYGKYIENYIEAHHTIPISTLPDDGAVLEASIEDFMVLCSNCHKAIHKAGCPDLDSFKKSLTTSPEIA